MAPPVKANAADLATLIERVAELTQTVAEMQQSLQKQLDTHAHQMALLEGRQMALQYRAQELARGT